MKQNISHEFHPVKLKVNTGDVVVSSVEGAAEELLTDWPEDDGDGYYEAVKACLDCLQGNMETEVVRQAFVRAAVEAGISVELEAVRLNNGLETEFNQLSSIQ